MTLSAELQAQDAAPDSGRRRSWVFVLSILAGALLLAWVAISSFDQQVYYYTVSEAAPQLDELQGRAFRLKGNVLPGTHLIREGTLDDHRFVLVDGASTMTVSFRGPLPDTFDDNAEVVALGRLDEQNVFVAEEISAKCPSRYEADAPTASE